MNKKYISVIMVIMLILITSIPVFGEVSLENKAEVLNQISILKGDGKDYNLEGQLKRNEAAAFIVRLIGEEKEVLTNKGKYIVTDFPDVDSNAWYAEYVGYCKKNNIINGMPDGTFKPDEAVSEKAFLSMLLRSLGYIDISWDKVYSKAYEVGLVENSSYISKINDELDYIRLDVVNSLYNSLKLKIKDSDKTIVDRLIEMQVLSISLAQTLNLVKIDELKTDFVSIQSPSLKNVVIELNETINMPTKEQIRIYEKENEEKVLTIEDIIMDDNRINIVTSIQSEGIEYSIELVDVKDIDDNLIKMISEDFMSYEVKEIISDYFRMSKVESISGDRINVYFTHPIKSNVEMPFYYSIFDDEGNLIVEGDFDTITAKKLGGESNLVGILLKKNTLKEGKEYVLKISGDVKSKYYAKLNKGKDEEFSFISTNISNEVFEIDSIELINSKYFRVTFSQDVDMLTALKSRNYSLKNITRDIKHGNSVDVISSGTVNKANELRQVDVRFGSSIILDDTYELTVDGVENIYQDRTLRDEAVDVYAYYDDESKIEIDYVVAFNDRHIRAYLSDKIDPSSLATSAIMIDSGAKSINTKASLISDSTIDIFLDDSDVLDDEDTHEFKITAGIKDIYGNDIGLLKYDFIGDDENAEENYSADSAKYISDDIVKIELEEPISTTANSKSNFKLKYVDDNDKTITLTIDDVHFIDPYTLIVEDNELSKDRNYKLYFVNVKDYSNQYIVDEFYKKISK